MVCLVPFISKQLDYRLFLFLVACFITGLSHSPIVQWFSLKTFMSISQPDSVDSIMLEV